MPVPDAEPGAIFALLSSPVGPLLAGCRPDGAIVRLGFADPDQVPAAGGQHPALTLLADELAEYFAGGRRVFTLPLAPDGTPFQRRVWEALRGIPYAETRTYGAVAAQVGSPRASRAVGRANHRNPIAIVIPCHRVVEREGRLGGYGGGPARKRFLLDLEHRAARPDPLADTPLGLGGPER